MENRQRTVVLIADDDADDRFLLARAAEKSQLPIKLVTVEDGGQLMDYLFQRKRRRQNGKNSLPQLILLDLNMPVKCGMDALEEIKSDEELKFIPVVIWTTSSDPIQSEKARRLGACDYIVKKMTFQGIVDDLKRGLTEHVCQTSS